MQVCVSAGVSRDVSRDVSSVQGSLSPSSNMYMYVMSGDFLAVSL